MGIMGVLLPSPVVQEVRIPKALGVGSPQILRFEKSENCSYGRNGGKQAD